MKRFDLSLAVILAAAMVFEVWAENLQPRWISAPLVLVAGLSLAWRRVLPIAVTVLVGVVQAVEAGAGMSLHTAVAPVVALLILSWSIGAYEDRVRAVLGLALLVGGVWLAMGIDVLKGTDHYVVTDVPWVGMLILLPGVLGMLFGARTRSLRAAEARAERLELERREAVAVERTRIARELHDVIAHSVSVMTVQAGAAEEMLKIDAARALEPVRAVQETGRQALVEMKRLVGMLREHDEQVGLAPQPGIADLDQLLTQVREAGLPVELRVEGKPRPVPIGVDLSVYRVVQEALTNALKHAGDAAAVVTLRYAERELAVEVADDGHSAKDSAGGHGLIGMRERVGVFGGTFEAGPRDTGGFAVRALLPLEAPA
ncbi:MAG: sensor histidine kinase [Gaiellaceae bacterium]